MAFLQIDFFIFINLSNMGRYAHYKKKNVSLHEWKMHDFVHSLNIVNTPKIIRYNKQKQLLTLPYLGCNTIANLYGDEDKDTPIEVFEEIRKIIKELYKYGIIYPDITGYNFIQGQKRIWIIDFEHAEYMPDKSNEFVEKFIDGYNGWNPDFK